ncbi:MAG: DUF4190 domain-containing protein [Planctomycetes bacterium]|nr:DUF4190 domain-containing protein [Planctomycetota bacterium]
MAGAVAATARTSGMAIASLVLGLVGIFACGFLGILAIIFGAVGMRDTRRDPNVKGRGLAVAGLILGIIDIVLWLVWLLILAASPHPYPSW